jgi:hypothetical protein
MHMYTNPPLQYQELEPRCTHPYGRLPSISRL